MILEKSWIYALENGFSTIIIKVQFFLKWIVKKLWAFLPIRAWSPQLPPFTILDMFLSLKLFQKKWESSLLQICPLPTFGCPEKSYYDR